MAGNKKTNNVWIPVIILASIALGIFIGLFAGRRGENAQLVNIAREISRNNNKLGQTITLIDKYYIDSVNTDSLVESLMPQLMKGLDPHSVYVPAKDISKVNEPLEGEFDGIGVVFNMGTDTIIVLNVVPNGPSAKAGVQNGDRIIMIDDSLVAGQNIPQDDIMKMLRGKRGTTVNLGIARTGVGDDLLPVTITRDKIALKSVDAAFMLTPDIGFIRLTTFSRNTHSEVTKALDGLRSQGMTKLIFDLRDNTGGFLDQAIYLANEFLPEGKLIVYTEDRYKKRTEEFSNGEGRFQDIELTFLIDEGSASSSEILAGAIQDNDRGTIIGRRSFGKGLVQHQIPFSDGSMVRLSIARYYTPTGRSIQKPYEPGSDEYEMDIFNRFIHSEMFSADSIRFDETMKFTTPGGKTVYGGGGIMPDIFVPIDTANMTKYYTDVVRRNILFRYTLDYADKHRDRINSVDSIEELNAMLDADTELLNDFVAYAARNGVQPDWRQIRKSEKDLLAQLRAYIGRNTRLEDAGFYSNIYPVDNNITEALKVFEDTDRVE